MRHQLIYILCIIQPKFSYFYFFILVEKCSHFRHITYISGRLPETIAILVNNAFKTVQQSAKDKEDICRRADARQRYLTQDFTLWWAGLRCIILEDCYILQKRVNTWRNIRKPPEIILFSIFRRSSVRSLFKFLLVFNV